MPKLVEELSQAIKDNNVPEVIRLLNTPGLHPNMISGQRTPYPTHAIHIAAENLNIPLITLLTSYEADPSFKVNLPHIEGLHTARDIFILNFGGPTTEAITLFNQAFNNGLTAMMERTISSLTPSKEDTDSTDELHNNETSRTEKKHSDSVSHNDDDNNHKIDDSQPNNYLAEEEILSESSPLTNLYSWLNDLPKWLHEQILESAPVKSFIENAKYMDGIYNKKSTEQEFAKRILTASDNSKDTTEDSRNENAMVAKNTNEFVDLTLVNTGTTDAIWMLTTSHMEAASFLAPNALAGLDGIVIF